MKTIYMVLFAIFFLLATIQLFLFFTNFNKNTSSSKSGTPSVPPSISKISVIATKPQNRSIEIPTDSPIQIDFNNVFNVKAINITFSPPINYSTGASEKSITIYPADRFATGTTYTLTITTPEMGSPFTLIFTTMVSSPQGVGPDTEFFQKEQEELRKHAPDAYLANLLPHSELSFLLTSTLDISTGKITFYVTTKGTDKTKSRQDAISWIKAQQLSDQQIEAFTIVYQ